MNAEIQQQMKQRIAQAALRKERAQSSQYRRCDISSEEEADVDHKQQQQQCSTDMNRGSRREIVDQEPAAAVADVDSEDEVCRSRHTTKRKKPRFM